MLTTRSIEPFTLKVLANQRLKRELDTYRSDWFRVSVRVGKLEQRANGCKLKMKRYDNGQISR